ncbi:hypothetical protein [Cohnella nanjingensis]|uniref:Uncharacterized protein n=1 Tax=Cohnella nanjingensis TaxID=1387779 RepID=A0A7X0RZS3_9BACL|nr:hypothetical protein [Cohnella nanjingensis]MBB6675300.1 hypothetical protein [Cohnella nanjingensis]
MPVGSCSEPGKVEARRDEPAKGAPERRPEERAGDWIAIRGGGLKFAHRRGRSQDEAK